MLNKLRNIGIQSHLSDEEKSVIRMVNDALLICILFTFVDSLSTLASGKFSTAKFTLMFCALFLFSLLLVHWGKYYFSRVFLTLVLGILLVVQSYLFGATVDITNIFIVLIVFVIVVFQNDLLSILLLASYIVAAFFLKNWIIINLDHPLAGQGMIYAKEVYFILSLLLVSILILRVLKRKDNYIDLSNSLLQDLEKNNSALKESNDRLKSFAYATSHDLKTPLRNVSSYIELMVRRISGPKDEKLQEYLLLTRKGVANMNESIDDILTLSSLDYNLDKWEDIEILELIHELKYNYQDKLESGILKIDTNMLPSIKGNRTQLFVLFQNLFDNSIKYNDSPNVLITISGKKTVKGVEIYFEDNGIGIEKEYASYVFEPFKRLHSNSIYEGTGLGLAIVKKIMDSHGGFIEIQSHKETDGTGFIIFFPNNKNVS